MYAFVIWIRTHALSKVHNHDFLSICHYWFLSTKPENKLHTWCTPIHLGDYRSGDQLKVWYVGNWHLLCLMTKCTGGRHHHLYSYLPLRVTGNSDSKESRLRSSRFVIEQFQRCTVHSSQDWCFALIYGVFLVPDLLNACKFGTAGARAGSEWNTINRHVLIHVCKWRRLFVPLWLTLKVHCKIVLIKKKKFQLIS